MTSIPRTDTGGFEHARACQIHAPSLFAALFEVFAEPQRYHLVERCGELVIEPRR